MRYVIGLVGAKGAGKTTAFQALAEIMPVEEITLAQKLKDVSSMVFELPREDFDSQARKERSLEIPVCLDVANLKAVFTAYGIKPDYDAHVRPHVGRVLHTPRQIAQYVGTEVLRVVDQQVHCRASVQGKLGALGAVTDMRFPNEYDFFEKEVPFFTSVYVKNAAAEVIAAADSHASEAHIQTLARRCHYTLDNSCSLDEYRRRCQVLFRSIIQEFERRDSV